MKPEWLILMSVEQNSQLMIPVFFYFLHFCSAKNTKRWWCISSLRKEKKWSKKVDIRKWVDSFLELIHMWSIFIYQDNRKRNVRQSMSQSPPLCILDQACWFPIKIIEHKMEKKMCLCLQICYRINVTEKIQTKSSLNLNLFADEFYKIRYIFKTVHQNELKFYRKILDT